MKIPLWLHTAKVEMEVQKLYEPGDRNLDKELALLELIEQMGEALKDCEAKWHADEQLTAAIAAYEAGPYG